MTTGRIVLLLLIHVFPHPVLVKPDGICISPDEFVHIHAVDGRRAFDAFLLAIDENGLVFLLLFSLRTFLGSGQLPFPFAHRFPPS